MCVRCLGHAVRSSPHNSVLATPQAARERFNEQLQAAALPAEEADVERLRRLAQAALICAARSLLYQALGRSAIVSWNR